MERYTGVPRSIRTTRIITDTRDVISGPLRRRRTISDRDSIPSQNCVQISCRACPANHTHMMKGINRPAGTLKVPTTGPNVATSNACGLTNGLRYAMHEWNRTRPMLVDAMKPDAVKSDAVKSGAMHLAVMKPGSSVLETTTGTTTTTGPAPSQQGLILAGNLNDRPDRLRHGREPGLLCPFRPCLRWENCRTLRSVNLHARIRVLTPCPLRIVHGSRGTATRPHPVRRSIGA